MTLFVACFMIFLAQISHVIGQDYPTGTPLTKNELSLKSVELTHTPPAAPAVVVPQKIETTTEKIQAPVNEFKSVKVTSKTSTTTPTSNPQDANATGTTKGVLTYEGVTNFKNGKQTVELKFDTDADYSISIIGTDKKNQVAFTLKEQSKDNSKRTVTITLDPEDRNTNFQITLQIPIPSILLDIGTDSKPAKVFKLTNNSGYNWIPADKEKINFTIKNGDAVIYSDKNFSALLKGLLRILIPQTQKPSISIPLEHVILTYTPPAPAAKKADPPAGSSAPGTFQNAVETIEEPATNVKSVKTTNTTVSTIPAAAGPKPDKKGTTTGLLIYAGDVTFDGQNPYRFVIDKDSADGLRVEILDGESKLDIKTKATTNNNLINMEVSPVDATIKKSLTVRLFIPIPANKAQPAATAAPATSATPAATNTAATNPVQNAATVEIVSTSPIGSGTSAIQEIKVTNGSAYNWERTCNLKFTVLNGNQVVYDTNDFGTFPIGGIRTLPVVTAINPKPSIPLTHVALNYNPPPATTTVPATSAAPAAGAASSPTASSPTASTSTASTPTASTPTASTPSTGAPSVSTPSVSTPSATSPAVNTPSVTVQVPGIPAVGTNQTTTESLESPIGNVWSLKTTSSTVTAVAPTPATPQTATGTTTGMLTYEGQFDFAQRVPFKLYIDPASFPGIRVELWDNIQTPVAWTLDSDVVDAAKVTKTNPQVKVGTVIIKPTQKTVLNVRVSVPVAANNSTVAITYAAKFNDNLSTLVGEIQVNNGSSVDWINERGFRLTVKNANQIIYDQNEFPSLTSGASRMVTQKIATNVDAETVYIDLATLVDATGKANPVNIARLPKIVKLDNGAASEDGQRLPLDLGSTIQLRWNKGVSPLINLLDKVQLATTLPLGTNCPISSGFADPNCCGPTGVCAANGPKEKQPHIAYLTVGDDPRVGVISASKRKPAAWIPLSFAKGNFVYLNGEHWKFQMCIPHDLDPSNVAFIDSRTGYAAFGSPPQLREKLNGSPQHFTRVDIDPTPKKVSNEPWSVVTTTQTMALTATPDEWATLLNAVSPNLNAELENLRFVPTDSYHEALATFYCLDPVSKKAIAAPDESGSPIRMRLQGYLTNLRDQLRPAVAAAAKYQKTKKSLEKVTQSLQTLDLELQQLTTSAVGDNFGPLILKTRLEIEAQQKTEKKLTQELQGLSRDLIRAITIANAQGTAAAASATAGDSVDDSTD